MKELVLIRGYPGSGKTTLGKALANNTDYVFVDHNAILTFIASFTGNDKGIYDDINNLELAITKKLLGEGKSVIVARGFSRPSSLFPYIKLAKSQMAKSLVLRLEVPLEVLAQRVKSLDRAKDFNPTKSQSSLTAWVSNNPIKDYHGEMLLDATQGINHLVELVSSTHGT